jgi:NAD-dependent deacetylase
MADWTSYKNLVVLTGAGVSAASGLRTYRGSGGLWEEHDSSNLATAGAFERDPLAVWQLFGPLRAAAKAAEPNAAHRALAALEARSAGSFTLITQNVDGLHQRAGNVNVIELHGSIHRTRCTNSACTSKPFEDSANPTELPKCTVCGSVLRPDVVLFDEALPGGDEHRAKKSLRDCDLFVAVGTSGTVSPASNFVRGAEYAGARTILVNLEPMNPPNPAFQEQLIGPAEQILPPLCDLDSGA